MKKHDARNRTLKITILYFIFGCAWILFSDRLVQQSFIEKNQVFFYSITKGLFYVVVTSILIHSLIYSTLRETLDGKEALRNANEELKKSNELYKDLYKDYRKKQALLKSLIDSVPDLIFYKDTNGVYMGCNAAFEVFIGESEKHIIGHTDTDLFPVNEAELFINRDIDMMREKTSKKNEEKVIYPDGREVILETLKTPYYDFEGNIIGLIGISRDITERKNREEKIKYINYHDNMTGIHNRTYFDEVRESLDCPEQLPLSVIIGDVNGMKMVNDAFGHVNGDKLLQEVANILKECVREEDVVARTGGDEFTILLPRADGQTVKEIVEHIRQLCDEKRHAENSEIYVDIALGYATKSSPEDSLDKVIVLAEDLMYRRKLLEQKSLHNDYLSYIKTTLFEKSNETEEHAERMAKLSKKLGEEMGLSEDELDELELVAMLHDIGKINIDKNILTKTDKLSDEDWREIKKHPEVGYRIASSTSGLNHIAEYILCHHEHWDGGGYSLGLSGTDIPLISRIVSVVDAYDAMTQDRAYRKALPTDVAASELLSHKGTQFDSNIVDIFVNSVLFESK
ncbi:MAG: diguanylate cyclase [Eubacteriales bacterium]|nr:diguanylate cyclase [Eubacteriales bacterium]